MILFKPQNLSFKKLCNLQLSALSKNPKLELHVKSQSNRILDSGKNKFQEALSFIAVDNIHNKASIFSPWSVSPLTLPITSLLTYEVTRFFLLRLRSLLEEDSRLELNWHSQLHSRETTPWVHGQEDKGSTAEVENVLFRKDRGNPSL